jgi:squalene-hopene/tetraprenyl-beta-curcumene cyclase
MRKNLAIVLAAAAIGVAGVAAGPSLVFAQAAPAAQAQAGDVSAQAKQVTDKAIAFLKSQQKPDGGWHGDKEPPAFTALVLRAIVEDPAYSYETDLVKKGYDRLLQHQVGEGGIYRDSLATYQTAIAISSLVAADNPEFKDDIDKAVEYLKGLQWGVREFVGPEGEKVVDAQNPWYGGWGYGGHSRGGGRPDLSNTQMALEALNDAGIPQDDPAYKASLQFISRLQNHSETNDRPWAGNDGGFVYSPTDDGRGESFAGEYIGPDGKRMLRSYGSMSYAGLKSMIHAGLTKDDPRVKAAWDWVTNNWTLDENPGIRQASPENAQWGLYYYYLTVARALNQYDVPTFRIQDGREIDWRVELVKKLAELQKEDGSWSGDKKWMEGNPVLVTSYIVQALHEVQEDLKQHPVK